MQQAQWCRGIGGALAQGSPARALNELVSEERLRVIELLGALTASSDLVEQQRCQIADLHRVLQQQVSQLRPLWPQLLPQPCPGMPAVLLIQHDSANPQEPCGQHVTSLAKQHSAQYLTCSGSCTSWVSHA